MKLVQKMFVRSFLLFTIIPFQGCSNTRIGEKLENSFEITDNVLTPEVGNKQKNKLDEIKKIKLRKKIEKNDRDTEKIFKENSLSSENILSQTTSKSIPKVIFEPQPYRIILKLSAANPSAPAETVTKALRKAGVKFEVEKIERFDDINVLEGKSLKRKEF